MAVGPVCSLAAKPLNRGASMFKHPRLRSAGF